MIDKHSPFLWPDRVIGKRESRKIREAHNALVNDYHALVEAVRAAIECKLIPNVTAKNGGPTSYAAQVHVADQVRDALSLAELED